MRKSAVFAVTLVTDRRTDVQTAENIVKLLSRYPHLSTLSTFRPREPLHHSKRNQFSCGAKYTVGWKNCHLRLKSPFILETVRDRPMVAMER